jgi:hypothetical protein
MAEGTGGSLHVAALEGISADSINAVTHGMGVTTATFEAGPRTPVDVDLRAALTALAHTACLSEPGRWLHTLVLYPIDW